MNNLNLVDLQKECSDSSLKRLPRLLFLIFFMVRLLLILGYARRSGLLPESRSDELKMAGL